jgi:hypothetical protein
MNQKSIFPLRDCAFWNAEAYRPSAWIQHVPFAFWLIDVLRPANFVELGTYQGMSYLAFCQAIKGLESNTKATAVDTWSGDQHAGNISSGALDSLRSVHNPRYSSFSTLFRSTFDDAVSCFGDKSIDLLHIDGLHTYDAVKSDFQTWLPKIIRSKPAIVLFHDTQVRQSDFGVYLLWSELTKEFPNFEFHHGHGLGVLGLGTNFPQELADLFSSERSKTAQRIREQFAKLGYLQNINALYPSAPATRRYYRARRTVSDALKRLASRR